MKILNSILLKICLIAVLIFSSQLSFADDIPILLPPDGTTPQPRQPNLPYIIPSASATISDTELAVYFEWSVGDATITVYDSDNNVVYQETVDTDTNYEVYIPVDVWLTGDYMITVTYSSLTQRGYFSLD